MQCLTELTRVPETLGSTFGGCQKSTYQLPVDLTMSNMMTDTFTYGDTYDSFYSDKQRFLDSGRQLFSTPTQTRKTAKSIPCFTEDVGALELDNWMKRHPKQWSNEDVLDLIYFVASRLSSVTVPDLRGERFQDVRGIDLYSMKKKEFIDREPRYGDLLYGCIQELLSKCDFTPPDDLMPPSVETVELFTETEDTKVEQTPVDAERPAAAAAAAASCYGQLPKPVEDLMMDDDGTSFEDAAAPVIPVRPAITTTRTGRGRAPAAGRRRNVPDGGIITDDKNNDEGPDDNCSPFLNIYGHTYDIDSGAEFHNVLLQPSGMVVDAEQDDGRCVYTDLSSARPGQHSYNVVTDASLPIDLRTTAATGLPLRTPLPTVLHHGASWIQHGGHPQLQGFQVGVPGPGISPQPHFSSGRPNQTGGPAASKKPSKKSTSDEQKSKAKSGKGDGSGMGRHLWEFIRDLLRSVDSGDQTVETIIRWENRSEGIFRIIDSKQVATLWGRRKRNVTMTYEKLSRALRWSRTFGFLSSVPKDGRYPKKLCFRFGPLANWKD